MVNPRLCELIFDGRAKSFVVDRRFAEQTLVEKRLSDKENSGRVLDSERSDYSTLDFSVASYLVDPASSHMLVSKIKPCMSKYQPH